MEDCNLSSISGKQVPRSNTIARSNRIFVVHGHDGEIKQDVARTLEKLKLEPIILHEQPNAGKTIIEKFEKYSDVGFAIVLLTPDDNGYPNTESGTNARPRARQNVIFEMGYFIGRLGRERVLVLYREQDGFEKPSDYDGVLYTVYDPTGRWRFELVKELKAVGYEIDANLLVQ
ncbi:MAG: nucleotide-binding protein [Anaerolineae bacterium]|nr:nucleotide-binding protein [Anaerolineae bacterium]